MKYISVKLVKWLLKTRAISPEKKELYEFAIYSFLFSTFPLTVVMCIGAILHMIGEGILMILPFIFIRKFSGGYHLKSPAICTISSIMLLFLFLVIIRVVLVKEQIFIFSIIVVISAISIFFNSPIDSEERQLSTYEKKVFRKICRTILTVFIAIYALMLFSHKYQWAIPVGAGIVLTAILQFPCLFIHLYRYFIQCKKR